MLNQTKTMIKTDLEYILSQWN